MTALPIEFSAPIAQLAARLGPFASRVAWHPEIGSTNDEAAALAERGADEGTVVLADSQTAGRGRLGRIWASPPGAGIYASVILRPEFAGASLITIAAGVAVAEGIEAATGLAARVKWPNDIFIPGEGGRDRKLAGILAESGAAADRRVWVVIGVGVNVQPGAYPSEVAIRASSLEAELGRAVDRGYLFAECLAAMWMRYVDLREGRGQDVLSAWRGRAAATFGRRVEWDAAEGVRRGVVKDIDTDGALLVATGPAVSRVISGEVRWI